MNENDKLRDRCAQINLTINSIVLYLQTHIPQSLKCPLWATIEMFCNSRVSVFNYFVEENIKYFFTNELHLTMLSSAHTI